VGVFSEHSVEHTNASLIHVLKS